MVIIIIWLWVHLGPGCVLPGNPGDIGGLSLHPHRVCDWHRSGHHLFDGRHREFVSCHWPTWPEVRERWPKRRALCCECHRLHHLHVLGGCLSEPGSLCMCSSSEPWSTLCCGLDHHCRSLRGNRICWCWGATGLQNLWQMGKTQGLWVVYHTQAGRSLTSIRIMRCRWTRSRVWPKSR